MREEIPDHDRQLDSLLDLDDYVDPEEEFDVYFDEYLNEYDLEDYSDYLKGELHQD